MLSSKFAAELDLKWEAQKAKFKLKFSEVTDDELAFDRTKKTEMLANLQLKLGRTSRELFSIIEGL
ncbi:MAG TPA: hypothetical protein VD927_18765 [Chryseosolibacter sp.]|nr:hypothetical protein [Chryseosolibacter sp.]